MTRPRSIANFEYCYLGAWLIGIVNLALTWNAHVEQATIAAARGGAAAVGNVSTFLILGIVVSAIITFVLWYFVARRGSVVAKWIVVALFAIGVISLLINLSSTLSGGIGGVLTIAAWVLQAIAVAMLFRPDAKAWFVRGQAAAS